MRDDKPASFGLTEVCEGPDSPQFAGVRTVHLQNVQYRIEGLVVDRTFGVDVPRVDCFLDTLRGVTRLFRANRLQLIRVHYT